MAKANEQTLIIERDIARLADDHTKLNQRFDRHLEIYAMNGKELAGVKVALDNLRDTITTQNTNQEKQINDHTLELNSHNKEMNEIKISVSNIATKVSLYAAIASAVASAGMSLLISTINI